MRMSATARSLSLAVALALLGGVIAWKGRITGVDDRVPASVQVSNVELVDSSRATVDPRRRLDAPDRTLRTDLYVPKRPGRFPLIIFAHGLGGSPRHFTALLGAWADHGYVVAAPQFPVTSDSLGWQNGQVDYRSQPGDVSFLIDELLRLSAARNGVLSDRIDGEHIGLSGVSMGGFTTFGAIFNTCCHEPRIKAAIVMSGQLVDFPGSYEFTSVPVLIAYGSRDILVKPESGKAAYAQASPPKYLLEFTDGGHTEAFDNQKGPHDDIATAATKDFWDLYLKAEAPAKDRLIADSIRPGRSKLIFES